MNTIVINNVRDMNLTHVFECGQCFRWNREAEGCYTGVVSGYVCKASLIPRDVAAENQESALAECDADADQTLLLEVTGGDEAFWRNYFDLETDYSMIKEAIAADEPKITEAEEYGYGIRILNQELFEIIISFIVSQNNNIPRIKKCIEAICREFGQPLGCVFGSERFSFPSPEALAGLDVDQLMQLKLGYRSSYIIESSRKFIKDGAPACYDDVIDYMGVGPKVANCIRLFGLHEVDAFPVDTWVKHIMNDMYGFPESDIKGMMRFACDKFGKYAGYAQQYLFYYYRDRK